ncbi:MAG: ATP-binding cassette domain-containing protein [Actinomycetota bacterium]|nr:ATP-binding cassette domain-containing protein [Actinomycetota bacterium]
MNPTSDASPSPSAGTPAETVTLRAEGLSKTYGIVRALQGASITLAPGEIHALVGENGSGKSTFVGVVSGTVPRDSGTITVEGQSLDPRSPRDSQSAGILTVFQDGSLIPGLTVAQNFYIGTPAALRPAYSDMAKWTSGILEQYGLGTIPADSKTSSIDPGDRQLIEIVRAIAAKPRLLILDEATSALDASGVDRVLDLVAGVGASGSSVLFVTHRLSEVFRVAHRISVLRDGILRATMPSTETDYEGLVEIMAGTSVDVEYPERTSVNDAAAPLLEARDLVGPGFGPVSLTVRAGEIVGIAGADGNGQRQLLRGLAGVGEPSGSLTIEGKSIRSYGEAVRNHVLFLSGDRRKESLFQPLSIKENLTVGVLRRLSTAGVISPSRQKASVESEIDQFGIKVGSPVLPVTSLSGGNQQKVALSRALVTEPRVMLIEEPTQGVDVRSRMDIYRMLRSAADGGIGVVIGSSDASELAGMADRIIVMSRGKVVAELAGMGSSEESIVGSFSVATHTTVTSEVDDAPIQVEKGRLRRMFGGAEDFVRLAGLSLIVAAIWIAAIIIEPNFGSAQNFYNVLLLTLPLAVLAVAQFSVMLLGGIDVSVGAMVGLTVVVMSFFITEGNVIPLLLLSLLIALLLGLIVGGVNATLTQYVKLSPVIATIATFGIVGGVALILRPTAGGLINFDLMSLMTKKVGFIPLPLLIIIPLLFVADLVLWRSRFGLLVRAAGLEPVFAFRLGVNVNRMRVLSYIAAAVIASIAGILVAGQVGTGDGTVGNSYTLLAIAAPVLGGASLLGGRGSFVGCLVGALMLSLATAVVPALKLSDAISFLLIGSLTLIALLAYSSAGGAISGFRRDLARRLGR